MERFVTEQKLGNVSARMLSNVLSGVPADFDVLEAIASGVPRSYPFPPIAFHFYAVDFGERLIGLLALGHFLSRSLHHRQLVGERPPKSRFRLHNVPSEMRHSGKESSRTSSPSCANSNALSCPLSTQPPDPLPPGSTRDSRNVINGSGPPYSLAFDLRYSPHETRKGRLILSPTPHSWSSAAQPGSALRRAPSTNS